MVCTVCWKPDHPRSGGFTSSREVRRGLIVYTSRHVRCPEPLTLWAQAGS